MAAAAVDWVKLAQEVPKLEDDNYFIWSKQLEPVLKMAGLWKAIEEGWPGVTEENATAAQKLAAKKAWLADTDMRSRAVLQVTLGRRALMQVADCESTKDMWTRLENLFNKRSKEKKQAMLVRFYNFKARSGQTAMDVYLAIQQLANDLRDMGSPKGEDEVTTRVVTALPEKYHVFKQIWNTLPDDNQSMAKLLNLVRALDEGSLSTGEELKSGSTFVAKGRGPKRSGNGSRQSNGNGRETPDKPKTCFECGKVGHIRAECYTRKKALGNKSKQDSGKKGDSSRSTAGGGQKKKPKTGKTLAGGWQACYMMRVKQNEEQRHDTSGVCTVESATSSNRHDTSGVCTVESAISSSEHDATGVGTVESVSETCESEEESANNKFEVSESTRYKAQKTIPVAEVATTAPSAVAEFEIDDVFLTPPGCLKQLTFADGCELRKKVYGNVGKNPQDWNSGDPLEFLKSWRDFNTGALEKANEAMQALGGLNIHMNKYSEIIAIGKQLWGPKQQSIYLGNAAIHVKQMEMFRRAKTEMAVHLYSCIKTQVRMCDALMSKLQQVQREETEAPPVVTKQDSPDETCLMLTAVKSGAASASGGCERIGCVKKYLDAIEAFETKLNDVCLDEDVGASCKQSLFSPDERLPELLMMVTMLQTWGKTLKEVLQSHVTVMETTTIFVRSLNETSPVNELCGVFEKLVEFSRTTRQVGTQSAAMWAVMENVLKARVEWYRNQESLASANAQKKPEGQNSNDDVEHCLMLRLRKNPNPIRIEQESLSEPDEGLNDLPPDVEELVDKFIAQGPAAAEISVPSEDEILRTLAQIEAEMSQKQLELRTRTVKWTPPLNWSVPTKRVACSQVSNRVEKQTQTENPASIHKLVSIEKYPAEVLPGTVIKIKEPEGPKYYYLPAEEVHLCLQTVVKAGQTEQLPSSDDYVDDDSSSTLSTEEVEDNPESDDLDADEIRLEPSNERFDSSEIGPENPKLLEGRIPAWFKHRQRRLEHPYRPGEELTELSMRRFGAIERRDCIGKNFVRESTDWLLAITEEIHVNKMFSSHWQSLLKHSIKVGDLQAKICLDAGSTSHLCGDDRLLLDVEIKASGKHVRFTSGRRNAVVCVGTWHLGNSIEDKGDVLKLRNVCYVPGLSNIVSEPALLAEGYDIKRKRGKVEIWKDGKLVTTGQLDGNRWVLNLAARIPHYTPMFMLKSVQPISFRVHRQGVILLDSGSASHVCGMRDAFISYEPLADALRPTIVVMPNGGMQRVEGVGSIVVQWETEEGPVVMVVHNVYYIPRSVTTLSEGNLMANGYSIQRDGLTTTITCNLRKFKAQAQFKNKDWVLEGKVLVNLTGGTLPPYVLKALSEGNTECNLRTSMKEHVVEKEPKKQVFVSPECVVPQSAEADQANEKTCGTEPSYMDVTELTTTANANQETEATIPLHGVVHWQIPPRGQYHMCSNKEWFWTYKKHTMLNHLQVIHENEDVLRSFGEGNIVVELATNQGPVVAVLPSVHVLHGPNLLSEERIRNKGFVVAGVQKGRVTFKHKESMLEVSAVVQNGAYYMPMKPLLPGTSVEGKQQIFLAMRHRRFDQKGSRKQQWIPKPVPKPRNKFIEQPWKNKKRRRRFMEREASFRAQMDSGASSHLCNRRDLFTEYLQFPVPIEVGKADSSGFLAHGAGSILVQARNCKGEWITFLLKDVLYVPGAMNLLSESKFLDGNWSMQRTDKGTVLVPPSGKRSRSIVAEPYDQAHSIYFRKAGRVGGKMYSLSCRKALQDKDQELWHRRMCHINNRYIKTTAKRKAAKGLPSIRFKGEEHCRSCLRGKFTRLPYHKVEERKAKKPGDIVHFDVAGPIRPVAYGGYRYFLLMKDEASSYRRVMLMKHKSDAENEIKLFIEFIKNQTGNSVKAVRSDRGREFLSNEFRQWLHNRGIVQQLTVPHNPASNGRIERDMRTVKEAANTMLIHAKCPRYLWGFAVKTAVYTLNRVINSHTPSKTPYEWIFGHRPRLDHLKIFGCRAYGLRYEFGRTSFEPKSDEKIMVGYDENCPGIYMLYDTHRKVVHEERNLKFLESDVLDQDTRTDFEEVCWDDADIPETLLPQGNSGVCTESPEESSDADDEVNISEDRGLPTSTDDVESLDFRVMKTPEVNIKPKRPRGRPRKQPLDIDRDQNRTCGMGRSHSRTEGGERTSIRPVQSSRTDHGTVQEQLSRYPLRSRLPKDRQVANAMKQASHIEPASFKEAMKSAEAKKWIEAMKEEMESHKTNGSWSLVPKPKYRRPLTCRWVFKKKLNKQGEVERYKARLVVRGFTQVEGRDYFETFSSVCRYESIRMILAIAAVRKYHIAQFDVKTAFLNGNLKELIYMEQPEGFSQDDRVCQLKKSVYGLKQAPRCWNENLAATLKKIGLHPTRSDECVFVNRDPKRKIILVYYVDDGLIVTKRSEDLQRVIDLLQKAYTITVSGGNTFLGMELTRQGDGGFFISQSAYTRSILRQYATSGTETARVPVQPGCIPKKSNCIDRRFPYRELVGQLLFLSRNSRPDIAFAVGRAAQYANCYQEEHWNMLLGILKYLRSTPELGLCFTPTDENIERSGCVATHFHSVPEERKSSTGYIFTLSGCPVTWVSQKQSIVSSSLEEAEMIATCQAVKEARWQRKLLEELGYRQSKPTKIATSEESFESVAKGQTQLMVKHIRTRNHSIQECLQRGDITLKSVERSDLVANVLARPLHSYNFVNCVEGLRMKTEEKKAQRKSHQGLGLKLLSWKSMLTTALLLFTVIAPVSSIMLPKAAPIVWRRTSNPFSNGAFEVHLRIKLVSICDVVHENLFPFNTTWIAEAKCHEMYEDYFMKPLTRVCQPVKTSVDVRRKKRMAFVIIGFIVMAFVTAAASGLGILVARANSDYRSQKDEIARMKMKLADESYKVNLIHEVSHKIAIAVEKVERALNVTAAKLEELEDHVVPMTFGASYVVTKLIQAKHILQETLTNWRVRKVYPGFLSLLGVELECGDACPPEFSTPDSCIYDESSKEVIIKMFTPKVDWHQYLLRAEGFTLVHQKEDQVCTLKYTGPKLLAYSEDTHCLVDYSDRHVEDRSIVVPVNRICLKDQNYETSHFHVDKCFAKEKFDLREIVQIKLHNDRMLVYCPGNEIIIDNSTFDCPSHVFSLSPVTTITINNQTFTGKKLKVVGTSEHDSIMSFNANLHLHTDVNETKLDEEVTEILTQEDRTVSPTRSSHMWTHMLTFMIALVMCVGFTIYYVKNTEFRVHLKLGDQDNTPLARFTDEDEDRASTIVNA